MDDQQFRQLLSRFGFSWDGFRKVRRGAKRRVSRHMQQMGCRTMQAYFSVLDRDEEARQHFERLMTVSISRFLRDRRLWEVLETQILPAITKEHKGSVNVWSAGCACGEEVYSLKILWEAACRRFHGCPELEIWASDMNPIYLDKARTGIYTRSSLKEVPEALRAEYFQPVRKHKRYAISESLKQGIFWREDNLLFDSPGTDFHLVFLRNSLLTYYEDKLKAPAFQRVLDRLVQGGFLIIGSHEKIPPGEWGLVPFGRVPYIFQKMSVDNTQRT